ncbi:unnamed protein product [Microthlaspi erraticum]|uniref:Uncharacterized protein n=1 Tax=Microthlaspi erraticum TaxID=1685480 RepID=A0A6D2JIG1_9BRAS|nr:unnamed protein product [Microthlaspi erraticum]
MSTSALERNAVLKAICETVDATKVMDSPVEGRPAVLNGESGNHSREEVSHEDMGSDPELGEEKVPDCARLDGIPRKVEMPWRWSARSLARDGQSGMTEEIIVALREREGISDAVQILVPSPDQRPMDAPSGWFCIYECFLTEFRIRFPVLPLLLEYAYERGVALSQLTHGVVRHMVFSAAQAKAAGMKLDRELFERITDLRAGVKEGSFNRFHTSMKHDIVFGDHRTKIHHWTRYYFFFKVDRASVGDFDPKRIAPRKVNTILKEKFRTLRNLSRETWADVVAETENKKKEKKGKATAVAVPLTDKLPDVAKKTGLRKRAPALVDDGILISDSLSKRMRSDSCEPSNISRPPGSLGGAARGGFSSPTVMASSCRDDDITNPESGDVEMMGFAGIDSDVVSLKWKRRCSFNG